MQHNNNHSTAAAKPAACTAKAANSGNNSDTRRRYEVGETTAALVDCITATGDLYDKIIDALAKKYGSTIAAEDDRHSAKYLYVCNMLCDMLQADLREHFADAVLNDATNSHADVVQL